MTQRVDGLLAPAGTPEPVVARINAEMAGILQAPGRRRGRTGRGWRSSAVLPGLRHDARRRLLALGRRGPAPEAASRIASAGTRADNPRTTGGADCHDGHRLRRAGTDALRAATRRVSRRLARTAGFARRTHRSLRSARLLSVQREADRMGRSLAPTIRAVAPVLILPADDVTVRTFMQFALEPWPACRVRLDGIARADRSSAIRRAGSIRSTRRCCSSWRAAMELPSPTAASRERGRVRRDRRADRLSDHRAPELRFGRRGCRSLRGADASARGGARLRRARRMAPVRPAALCRAAMDRWQYRHTCVARVARSRDRRSHARASRDVSRAARRRFGRRVRRDAAVAEATAACSRCLASTDSSGRSSSSTTRPAVRISSRSIDGWCPPRMAAHESASISRGAALRVAGDAWTGPRDLPPGPGTRLGSFRRSGFATASAWLRTLPSDSPWPDPPLFAAMVQLRHRPVLRDGYAAVLIRSIFATCRFSARSACQRS